MISKIQESPSSRFLGLVEFSYLIQLSCHVDLGWIRPEPKKPRHAAHVRAGRVGAETKQFVVELLVGESHLHCYGWHSKKEDSFYTNE